MDLADVRRSYGREELRRVDLDACPIRQFERWLQQAFAAQLQEPNAMVLATATARGEPTQRTVLLKYFDRQGFVFFSHYHSRKARQINENHHVSLLFPWIELERQVEINGTVEKVGTAESVRYFATRPRGSQIGAWCSQQSSIVESRAVLIAQLAELKRRFSNRSIPLPTFWGGFRVAPERIEFWQGRPNRLHDRFQYIRSADGHWTIERLAP